MVDRTDRGDRGQLEQRHRRVGIELDVERGGGLVELDRLQQTTLVNQNITLVSNQLR